MGLNISTNCSEGEYTVNLGDKALKSGTLMFPIITHYYNNSAVNCVHFKFGQKQLSSEYKWCGRKGDRIYVVLRVRNNFGLTEIKCPEGSGGLLLERQNKCERKCKCGCKYNNGCQFFKQIENLNLLFDSATVDGEYLVFKYFAVIDETIDLSDVDVSFSADLMFIPNSVN